MTFSVITNRIMFAAPKSGSGKTLITCGFLNLLKNRNLDVISFKCGPDYIDPMFHRKVLGIYGGNLDTYFCSHEKVREIVGGCGHSYAVLEGVMGIYDGIGGLSLEGSCYDIAAATDTPIVLIVDARGAGRTIISTVKGILSDDEEELIKGIILNDVSSSFYERLRPLVETELKDYGSDVKLIGYLPHIKDAELDSRHLGLMLPDEIEALKEKVDRISGKMEECLDVELLIKLMEEAKYLEVKNLQILNHEKHDNLTLAVAMDDAFCFYYRENLELFKELGVNLKLFSPKKDKKLPENIQGIYIGGGYPELHLKELSENSEMLRSIKDALDSGLPSIAECGGFMYLHEAIFDDKEERFEMVGAVPGYCKKQDHLVRFGYVELNSPVHTPLNRIRGHEFHYYDSTANGSDMIIRKAGEEKSWEGMYVDSRRVWGFPHLYLQSKPEFVYSFVEAMRDAGR